MKKLIPESTEGIKAQGWRGKVSPASRSCTKSGFTFLRLTIFLSDVAIVTKDGVVVASSVAPQIHFCSHATLLMTGISGVLPVSA